MKLNKIILACALSAGFVSLSQAASVYVTGSTAMRSIFFTALSTAGDIFSSAPAYTVYDGGSTGNNAGNGGNYMAFVGTATAANGGGPLTVKCHWSGSEEGIHDVASGLSQTFIADSAIDGADHGTNQPGATESQTVDLAMGDNAQSFSQFSVKKGFPNIVTNKFVGVITFTFVRNPGVWTGGNISSSQFRQAEGLCPQAVFTGVATDTTNFVYVSGRNNLSGTRVNTFGDTGYGISTPAQQIQLDSSGNMIDQGGGVFQGDYGFSSGGTLAKTLGTSTTTKSDPITGSTGFSVVAYLSRGDADTAIGLSAVELTYNGVAQSRTNVIEGTHTLWGNEFIFQHGGASVTAQKVYTTLSTSGTGIDAAIGSGTKAIKTTDMHCTRTGPNADPSHN
jgi:hypothetical protein